MEPYQKNLLEQILKKTEENNEILRSLRNNTRWSMFFGFIKWAIILGPLIWAYIYFQPYMGTLKNIFQQLPQQLKTVEGIGEQFKSFDSMMKSFPKLPQ